MGVQASARDPAAGGEPRVITVPTPFPVGPVNVLVLPGEPLAIVDAGPHSPEAQAALTAGLRKLGRRPEEIARVVITHAHADHYGLASWIVGRSGAEVIAHPLTHAWGDDDNQGELKQFMLRTMRAGGVPDALIEGMRSIYEHLDGFAEPLPVDREVNDGDELQLGGSRWTVLHTPGHASGHICLWSAEQGVLLSGDHLIGHISSNAMIEPVAPGDPRPGRSLPAYLESLRRTAGLGVRVAYPGHGDVVRKLGQLIDDRLRHHDDRKLRLAEFLGGGPATAYELSARLFPRLHPSQVFLAISEVLGHLQLLEEEGSLAEEWDGPVRKYFLK